ncbi:MAG: DUF3445 domain-containing protein [Actinobacteria bacterium]|nr:DUF3445 domain-containing protein [Actinomycetota bacterium]
MHIRPGDPLRSYAVPLTPRPYRMVVGTRPTSKWLLPGVDGPPQLAAKVEVLRKHAGAAVAVLPGAEHGVELLADLVDSTVPAGSDDGSGHRMAGSAPEQALASVALRVQEDLCLLQRRSGQWRLWAACVCFPSHWRLTEKIGAGLDAIHGPVPGYRQRLATASTKVLDRLAGTTEIVERFNWVLVDTPRLYTPRAERFGDAEPRSDVDGLWLRTERQTLRALPGDLGLVFTIRTFVTPLTDLTRPERGALAKSMHGISDELHKYRSSLRYRNVVMSWLAASERTV